MIADPQSLIIWLIIGAVAGWLAGQVMKGYSFGLVGDIVVGILGAVVAGFLFPALNFRLGSGIVGEIISAAIGACILLFVARLIRRA
jgi:uncharacterized membrane protein YeaQ/YmgE (transglycosylase-associated protein family)